MEEKLSAITKSNTELVQFRRELHQYPEVSQDEYQTQDRIINFLSASGIHQVQKIGGTGVICVFEGKTPGRSVMLRADTDALPIQEVNTFDHASQYPGVSHKCGHDGHTTIMCGVAQHLLENPIEKGKVILVFQPAEENGEGAKAVLSDSNFNYTPDIVFALHNLPGYEKHKVVCRNGSFTAAATSIIIKLLGKTSHAAEPELGINPAMAMGELVEMFEEESNPILEHDDFALATPIHMNMGELSYGVSAGYGEVHYTLRTWDNPTMEDFKKRLQERVGKICEKYSLASEIGWTQEFEANNNNATAVDMITDAAASLGLSYETRPTPFKWGEDFGLFTQKFDGAMFGIGSGLDSPALHNPDYDFPDEIISTGINMFTGLIKQVLDE